jgi:excisionase family DNA binding protein
MNSAFQTNSNNTVPDRHLASFVEEVVSLQLNNCLIWRIQCVTCDEAAVLLSVDTDTIREWIKAGKLTASKVGREYSIRVMDIDKMLATHSNVIRLEDKRFKRNRKTA